MHCSVARNAGHGKVAYSQTRQWVMHLNLFVQVCHMLTGFVPACKQHTKQNQMRHHQLHTKQALLYQTFNKKSNAASRNGIITTLVEQHTAELSTRTACCAKILTWGGLMRGIPHSVQWTLQVGIRWQGGCHETSGPPCHACTPSHLQVPARMHSIIRLIVHSWFICSLAHLFVRSSFICLFVYRTRTNDPRVLMFLALRWNKI